MKFTGIFWLREVGGKLLDAIERFTGDLATVRVASIITGYENQDSRKGGARGSAADLAIGTLPVHMAARGTSR
ncbi:MAG: hypothetical protein HY650_02330 [Acidobacteria bacterium]|nr:hypothetical protein [Acidobacteriota bacterium]